jgi:hypothetical protein
MSRCLKEPRFRSRPDESNCGRNFILKISVFPERHLQTRRVDIYPSTLYFLEISCFLAKRLLLFHRGRVGSDPILHVPKFSTPLSAACITFSMTLPFDHAQTHLVLDLVI